MTAAVASLSRPARVLRLEIRRSTVPWTIPLLAALFFFDAYRTGAGYPAIWSVRASIITNRMVFDFSGFAAGLSAWVGSREGRRNTGDLLATTVRPAWVRQAAALAGTLFWLVLTFLAAVAVLYVETARQATWGGPPLWPVIVGVAGVITTGVAGFTAGVLVPGRFTAPLVAIVVLALEMIGFRQALAVSSGSTESTYALLSPATVAAPVDLGLFYHVPPDVAIAQVMFMGGITVAALGLLMLAPQNRASYRDALASLGRAGGSLRVVAVALVAGGVAASCTAFALTGTARQGVAGWEIPALHDAASDQPIAYTPDCTGTAFQVCVHPAFGYLLGDVAAALDPVAAEIAGLPGAPVRAEEVVAPTQPRFGSGSAIAGNPPVFTFNADSVGDMIGAFRSSAADASSAFWRASFQQGLLQAFVAGSPQAGPGGFASGASASAAQQAVLSGLMIAVGSAAPQFQQAVGPTGQPTGPTAAQVAAAAQRFASLSSATRHAWLAVHLAALRAGHITLAQLP